LPLASLLAREVKRDERKKDPHSNAPGVGVFFLAAVDWPMLGCERQSSALPVLTAPMAAARRFSKLTILAPS